MNSNKRLIIMSVTVDDFTVAATSIHVNQKLLCGLRTKYNVKYIADPYQMIGWAINRNANYSSIHISQLRLAQTIIELVKMYDSKTSPTPISLCNSAART